MLERSYYGRSSGFIPRAGRLKRRNTNPTGSQSRNAVTDEGGKGRRPVAANDGDCFFYALSLPFPAGTAALAVSPPVLLVGYLGGNEQGS